MFTEGKADTIARDRSITKYYPSGSGLFRASALMQPYDLHSGAEHHGCTRSDFVKVDLVKIDVPELGNLLFDKTDVFVEFFDKLLLLGGELLSR